MNDRDKTDVWSTSGVILIIFKSLFSSHCFVFALLFLVFGLAVTSERGDEAGGTRRKKES
jgi:hypothetical protein